MIRLSFRFLLGLALVFVNVGLAAVVATFAYNAAHDAMVQQAQRSIALVAQSRERELIDRLERRQQRLEGFLLSLSRLCGETNPSGSVGLEPGCRRTAVNGLHSSERATTTTVRSREVPLVSAGEVIQVHPPFPGQLARIEASDGTGRYVMRAVRNELSVEMQFDIDDLNTIFLDRAGLEANGEAFLTDRLGYRLTAAPFVVPAGYPVDMPRIGECLQGATLSGLTTDYRGVHVISGVRPVAAVGGGCLVANVTYDDATLPVRQLGSLLVYAAAVLGLLGGVISMVVASFVTRPIKRLAAAAQDLADGDLDAIIPVSGASEVRRLGKTLSSMASAIRELVHREQKARKDAESASKTKDDFLATLSHELRTPLNAILGWASILTRTDYDRARVSHAVKVIERNARVQSQMIEELLDLSRIAAGRVRLSVTDVLVASAVDAAVESVRPAAEAKGITIDKDVEAAAKTVSADPRRLQQILWNMLSNAVRFTPVGGRVHVSAREVAGRIEIAIADTGCGISKEFLPLVFERFRQADSSTTRAHGGLGLGLAIVRDLVKLHGGEVRAESPGEGQGSTFTVRLLMSRAAPDAEIVAPKDDRHHHLSGASVLVVDDDADAREVLRTILENAGAKVTTTSSARETRAVLSETHPDLLIADIGMPEEDGYSLIQSIRNLDTEQSRVPAIALTAHSRPEDVEQALASGFQMHVAKPIDSTRLVASIASLFDAAV